MRFSVLENFYEHIGSGIGAKGHLQDHGIETIKDLPGVGEHLVSVFP